MEKKKKKKTPRENVNKFVLFGLKRPSVVILFIFEIFSWLNILWSLNSPTKEWTLTLSSESVEF